MPQPDYSDIVSDIPTMWKCIWHILHILSYSDVLSDILSGILSGIYTDILSGRCSGPGVLHCIRRWRYRSNPLAPTVTTSLRGGDEEGEKEGVKE